MDSTAKKLKIEYKSSVKFKDIQEALKAVYGGVQPHNQEMEEAVLGACILVEYAWREIRFLEADHFYFSNHTIIYRAIRTLSDTNQPIDLLTVTHQLRKENKLDAIGGPTALVELTNRVASDAHIVKHARIIYELHLRREGIAKLSQNIGKMFGIGEDIFDLRNELAQELRIMPPTGYLQAQTMQDAITDGMNEPPMLQLFGNLWRTGEITLLWGEEGSGKSILAVQVADCITKGEPIFDGITMNECDAMKILYCDFELLKAELASRYTNQETGAMYDFDKEKFIRITENDDWDMSTKVNVIDFIEDAIATLQAEALIVDNITWLTSQSAHDTDVALELMKRLKSINKRSKMPMLILAHSKKRTNKTQPIDKGDLAGSAHISRFATNSVAIGRSAADPEIRYIKQVKQRNGKEVYTEDNVIVCTITKKNNMVQFEYLEMGKEQDHLADWNNKEAQEEIIEKALELRTTSNQGWESIKDEVGFKGSRNTLIKKCKQFVRNSLEYEFTPETGEFKKKSWEACKETEEDQNKIDPKHRQNDDDIPF